jgi:hypothetical protein
LLLRALVAAALLIARHRDAIRQRMRGRTAGEGEDSQVA